ncbi:hypothetical protein ZWY2020_016073 [Hordeum vulgare]|nr:hypothetical protein ZWY2020_016073 [Hordeum vulgare]
MEARKLRVAAIAALCVLLLVLPGQVAAKSKFCECYEDCYRQCRHHILRFAMPALLQQVQPQRGRHITPQRQRTDQCKEACAKVKICSQSDPSDGECEHGRY